jgi:hypothetical protein
MNHINGTAKPTFVSDCIAIKEIFGLIGSSSSATLLGGQVTNRIEGFHTYKTLVN